MIRTLGLLAALGLTPVAASAQQTREARLGLPARFTAADALQADLASMEYEGELYRVGNVEVSTALLESRPNGGYRLYGIAAVFTNLGATDLCLRARLRATYESRFDQNIVDRPQAPFRSGPAIVSAGRSRIAYLALIPSKGGVRTTVQPAFFAWWAMPGESVAARCANPPALLADWLTQPLEQAPNTAPTF